MTESNRGWTSTDKGWKPVSTGPGEYLSCTCTENFSCFFHADKNPHRTPDEAFKRGFVTADHYRGAIGLDPERERDKILTTARSLISGDREQDYGDARENFTRLGKLWEQVLGVPVRPEQAALCLALLKVSRLCHQPTHRDSWIDACGYLALGGELAETPHVVRDTPDLYQDFDPPTDDAPGA